MRSSDWARMATGWKVQRMPVYEREWAREIWWWFTCANAIPQWTSCYYYYSVPDSSIAMTCSGFDDAWCYRAFDRAIPCIGYREHAFVRPSTTKGGNSSSSIFLHPLTRVKTESRNPLNPRDMNLFTYNRPRAIRMEKLLGWSFNSHDWFEKLCTITLFSMDRWHGLYTERTHSAQQMSGG